MVLIQVPLSERLVDMRGAAPEADQKRPKASRLRPGVMIRSVMQLYKFT